MKKLLTLFIIIGLFTAGWALAQKAPKTDSFEQKLSFHFRKAQNKIISALEKPLGKLNTWFIFKLKGIKENFFQELEEMKISFMDLLKWGWKKGVKSRL